MLYKHLLPLSLLLLTFFSACSSRDGLNPLESIYTQEEVVKPTSKNYASAKSTGSTPIIKETTPSYNSSENAPSEKQSVHVKLTGHITHTTFDQGVKLYLYTFISSHEKEESIFYYDKKLNYRTSSLLDVDILDNYLITAKKHKTKSTGKKKKTKKYIKHKKRNYNIREAIEEKINTF